MYKDKRILALIPAREGSKRLIGKNTKLFLGKPLIPRPINEAKKSKYIDSIVVSTDDKKIAAISKTYGASVPFIRPKRLATDSAKSMDVILHALEWFQKKSEVYDLIMLLQPTSPLMMSSDIDSSIKLLFSKDATAIVSVFNSGYKPLWSAMLSKNGCMKNFIKKSKSGRKAPEHHTLNGAIYLSYCDYLKKHKSFFGNKTFAYIMPEERSIDIDNEFEFKIAEELFKYIK